MISLWTLSAFLALGYISIEFVQSHPSETPADSSINVLKTEDLERTGWRMVFRGTSGNGHSVYHAWIHGTNTNPGKPIFMNRTNGLHYRDRCVNNWSNLNIKLVKFAFYDTDKEVAHIIFNGKDSDINSWFDKSRVVDSSWPDLTSTSVYNYFSIAGDADGKHVDRRFYINRNESGCDPGHLVSIDSAVPIPACPLDDQNSYPAFIYLKYNSEDLYQRAAFGSALFLVISIT